MSNGLPAGPGAFTMDDPRPGPHEVGVGVDGPHLGRRWQGAVGERRFADGHRGVEVVAAGRDDHDFGWACLHGAPIEADRVDTWFGQQRFAPAVRHEVWHPVAR